jgi:endo-beta-N-acetylglucosaminidase D
MTQPLAIFIALVLNHGLRSSSSETLQATLTRQQHGFLPFLFQHVEVNEVYNFMDFFIGFEKTPDLHKILGIVLCENLSSRARLTANHK